MGFIGLERQVFLFRKICFDGGTWAVACISKQKWWQERERNALDHSQQPALSYKQDTTASWLNWANMSGPAICCFLQKRLPPESQSLFLCFLPFITVFQSYVTSLVSSRLIIIKKMILVMKDHVMPRGWMLFFHVVLVGC